MLQLIVVFTKLVLTDDKSAKSHATNQVNSQMSNAALEEQDPLGGALGAFDKKRMNVL